ncbi:fibrinogen C domain-containing protein 1-like isoform X2 [Tribolium madens]|uniref:fibrinogen C domain-containing protein 1-like isoform X2 n=1 Tax=Tribolium madens TaxID=41895 RepID=UPI001CF73C0D|nr:fibrinogen C domain-containing protein 1-like isoform X2 [Tribolium madens]
MYLKLITILNFIAFQNVVSPECTKTTQLPKHCKEVQANGRNISGFYRIQPDHSPESFMVLCDFQTRGGGWTYILSRFDGSQNFYLTWSEYKSGFGNLAGEFWLGLEHLYALTGYEANELLVELVDWEDKKGFAHYNAFSIGNENEGYILRILGEYSGDAGDDLSVSLGEKFSTKDRDQDSSPENCATLYNGAWWYNNCMACQLTGKYLKTKDSTLDEMAGRVMYWNSFRGVSYSLKQARMMVRPRSENSTLPHRN